MGKDCSPFVKEIVKCLSNSDCVKNHVDRKRALKDCAQSRAGDVPQQCFELIGSYNRCWESNVSSCLSSFV